MANCGGCTSEWTGAAMAHCPLCHETFSTASNFDSHFATTYKYKQLTGVSCKTPTDAGLTQNSRGTWIKPDERDLSELHKLRGKKIES